jgi:hypothetical protein
MVEMVEVPPKKTEKAERQQEDLGVSQQQVFGKNQTGKEKWDWIAH